MPLHLPQCLLSPTDRAVAAPKLRAMSASLIGRLGQALSGYPPPLAVGGNAMNELFGLQGTIIFGFAMVLYWIGRHIAL